MTNDVIDPHSFFDRFYVEYPIFGYPQSVTQRAHPPCDRCLTPAWTDNGIRTAASADQRWTAQWVYNTAETLMTFFVACSDPNFEWVGLGISTSGTNACSRSLTLSRPRLLLPPRL